MKVCPNCGHENAEDYAFCEICGTVLQQSEEPAERYGQETPETPDKTGMPDMTGAQETAGTDAAAESLNSAEPQYFYNEQKTDAAGETEAAAPEKAASETGPAPALIFCPNCGARNTAGENYCCKCGSVLTVKAPEPVKKPKAVNTGGWKKALKVIGIVLASIVVLAAVGLFAATRIPEVMVPVAAANTARDMTKIEVVNLFSDLGKNGSVTVSAGTEDSRALRGMLGGVEAEAEATFYFNGDKDRAAVSAELELEDADAISAALWITPKDLAVQSRAILGRNALGINLEKMPENIGDSYLARLAGISPEIIESIENTEAADLTGYKKRVDSVAARGCAAVGKSLLKNCEKKVSSEKLVFVNREVRADVYELSYDEDQIAAILDDLIDWLESDTELEELAADIAEDELLNEAFYDLYDVRVTEETIGDLVSYLERIRDNIDMPEDIELRCYVKNFRLIGFEAGTGREKAEFLFGPDPAKPEEISMTVKEGKHTSKYSYTVREDSESGYSAKLKAEGEELAFFKWDKKKGSFDLSVGGSVISGKLESKGNKVSLILEEIDGEELNIRTEIDRKAKYPDVPSYEDVLEMDEDEISELGEEIEEALYELRGLEYLF